MWSQSKLSVNTCNTGYLSGGWFGLMPDACTYAFSVRWLFLLCCYGCGCSRKALFALGLRHTVKALPAAFDLLAGIHFVRFIVYSS